MACESFRKEMDLLTEGDPDIVHKEYLEFGLHSYPQDLKKAVVEHVNALQGKVDAVFLGFGTCNSLKDVQRDLIIPTVTIEADDCVGALLTNEEYAREKRICAGTMFAIPFISEMGTEYFEKELYSKMPNYEELGVDAQWFLDMLFDGYSRVLLVDTGVGDREDLRSRSREMADRLGLRYEERQGTLQVLRDCLQNAKNLALASARS